MIRFIEVVNETKFNSRMERVAVPQFSLQEVWINEKHVTNLREAAGYVKLLQEGRLPSDLRGDHQFTTVTTSTGVAQETYVVVGDVSAVASRLNRDKTKLLKG